MDLELKNKNVIVVGGSKGIGLAISKAFLNEKATVHIISRNKTKFLDDLISNNRKKAFHYCCDVINLEQLMITKNKIMNSLNKIDIVISNVGNGNGSQDPITSNEEWSYLWQTNFSSSYNTAKVFIPELVKSDGNLIFVSSIAGIQSLGAPIAYSTSKSALITFSKALSIKLAPNVRVNVVAPGNIFFKDGTWDKKMKVNPEQVKQMISEKVPLKRFGNPEEVADLILFISSEKARFITGSCFVIDGGQTTNF